MGGSDALISFARGRGLTSYRLPKQVERLYTADRSDKIWTNADIDTFMPAASKSLQQVMIMALETAQRLGNLFVLPWSAYGADELGKRIRLPSNKTKTRKNPLGRLVRVPVTPLLADMLPARRTRQPPTCREWAAASREREL